MTPESERGNWRTPLGPPKRGRFWCVHSARGVYEFLVHPDDGAFAVENGLLLDGQRVKATKVCEWPDIGRWHIQVSMPEVNTGWIDAAAA